MVGEHAKVATPATEQDNVGALRIRIPPFVEPEETIVLPPWPKRVGTTEEILEIDSMYLDRLIELSARRRELLDRMYVASELMKYLYFYPALCETYPTYAGDMISYTETYTDLAEKLDTSYEEGYTETRHIKRRILYYAVKLLGTLERILG